MLARYISLAKTLFILIACFTLTFTLGCSVPRLVNGFLNPAVAVSGGEEEEEIPDDGYVDILLLGIDARKGETMARSDTIMLARIDKKEKKVAVVSIPRDTKIPVPGSAIPKINHACAIGGPELSSQVVGKLMGIKVDYYILTNFDGFKDIINTLGGVTIDVDSRKYKPSEGIDLRPGLQRLNGKQALAYVRYRDYGTGDIARTEHQQQFIKALADEMFQTKTIFKLPKLVPQLAKNIETNLTISEMVSMANMARNFNPENLHAQTLPGYFYDDPNNGISYWISDQKVATTILDDLLAGKQIDVVEESPYPTVKKYRGKEPSDQDTQPADKDVSNQDSAAIEPIPGTEETGDEEEPIIPYPPEQEEPIVPEPESEPTPQPTPPPPPPPPGYQGHGGN